MSINKKIDSLNLDLEKFLPENCIGQIGYINELQDALSQLELPVAEFKSEKRLREFIAGRNIAKKLIKKLTFSDSLIRRDSSFLPAWPAGITGSISHKGAICGAIISNECNIISLGLDIERYESIQEEIWRTYTDEEEIEKNALSNIDTPWLANIIFSCKESAFKAFYQSGLAAVKIPDISIALSFGVGRVNASAHFQKSKALGSVLIEGDIIVSWFIVENRV